MRRVGGCRSGLARLPADIPQGVRESDSLDWRSVGNRSPSPDPRLDVEAEQPIPLALRLHLKTGIARREIRICDGLRRPRRSGQIDSGALFKAPALVLGEFERQ